MGRFVNNMLANFAVRFPGQAHRVIRLLKNLDTDDREKTIPFIGAIGERVPATGQVALDFLEDHPGEESIYRISRIGLTNKKLSRRALDLLTRDMIAAKDYLVDYAIEKPEFTLQILDIMKDFEGDSFTKDIGRIALHCHEKAARHAFGILKRRDGELAAHQIANIAVQFPVLAEDALENLKSRTELDVSLQVGDIGREVEGMALPALAILREIRGEYADSQIEAIGKKVEPARVEAIRLLLERERYHQARYLTGVDRSNILAFDLKTVLLTRDYALAAGIADPDLVDKNYTTPLIGKIISGKESMYSKKGELAGILQRAATILMAEKPANDHKVVQSGVAAGAPEPRG